MSEPQPAPAEETKTPPLERFERLNKESLAALKARKYPRMVGEDMFTRVEKEGDGNAERAIRDEMMAAADKYCATFVGRRIGDGKRNICICCGMELTGIGWFSPATFTWGIANGEGHCGKCFYPARATHRIPDVGFISPLVIQYHPDELSFDDPVAAPDPAQEG